MCVDYSAYMGSKNISLRDEVYEELSREKAEGESFSDAIHRLISSGKGEHPLYGLVGLLDEGEAAEAERRTREFRRDLDEEMERSR